MRKRLSILAVGGLVSALAPSAMPACIYSFSTDQPTYDLSGGPVTVRVYLTETLTDGSASFADADGGVAGVMLTVSRASGNAGQITNATRNTTQFTDTWLSSVSFTPTQADVTNFTDGIPATGIAFNGDSRILMADITISPSGTNQAEFSVNIQDPGSYGYVCTANGTPLDLAPSGGEFEPITGASFTVSVPEPSMLGLVAASGLLLIRRRRSC